MMGDLHTENSYNEIILFLTINPDLEYILIDLRLLHSGESDKFFNNTEMFNLEYENTRNILFTINLN